MMEGKKKKLGVKIAAAVGGAAALGAGALAAKKYGGKISGAVGNARKNIGGSLQAKGTNMMAAGTKRHSLGSATMNKGLQSGNSKITKVGIKMKIGGAAQAQRGDALKKIGSRIAAV